MGDCGVRGEVKGQKEQPKNRCSFFVVRFSCVLLVSIPLIESLSRIGGRVKGEDNVEAETHPKKLISSSNT